MKINIYIKKLSTNYTSWPNKNQDKQLGKKSLTKEKCL